MDTIHSPEFPKPEDPELPLVQPIVAPLQFNIPRAIELSIPRPIPVPCHPEPIVLGISHVEVAESGMERLLKSVNVDERVEVDLLVSELPNEAKTQLQSLHAVDNEETSVVSHSPPCMIFSPPLLPAAANPEQVYPIPQLESFMLQLDHSPVRSSAEFGRIDSSQQQVLDVPSDKLDWSPRS